MWLTSFFKVVFNSFKYRVFLLPCKVEEPSLAYYLPISGGRIITLIKFSKALELCAMKTSVAMSISYDGNYYTMNVSPISIYIYIYVCVCVCVCVHKVIF